MRPQLEAWEPYVARRVAPNTAARFAVSMGQLQPFPNGPYLDEVTGALIVETSSRAQSVSNITIRRERDGLCNRLRLTQVPVFGSPAGNSRSGGVGLTRSSTLPIPDWTIEMNSTHYREKQ